MKRTVRPNSSVWLERQPVTLEVTSSSLVWVAIFLPVFRAPPDQRTCLDSSVGRARDWKSLCRRFDSTLRHHTDRFQSGQMDQTVNLTSQTSVVRIHLCPPKKDTRMGVPIRDYKKTKNILMGTPASASWKIKLEVIMASSFSYVLNSDMKTSKKKFN